MPDGRTHRKITTAVAVVSLPITIITPWWLVAEAGIIATYWINPDLDIHNHAGKLGKLLGYEEYRDMIPHRAGMSPSHWKDQGWGALFAMSHIPWAGTVTRLLILVAPIILGVMVLQIADRAIWRTMLTVGIWLWVGMGLSDLAHFLADWITAKPRKRPVRRYHPSKRRKSP